MNWVRVRLVFEAYHHVALAVHDLGQARAFYGGLLGLEELDRPGEFGTQGAWFRLGRSELHMFEQRDYRPQREMPGPHFALRCLDFDATVEKLSAAGCEFLYGPGRDSAGVARVLVDDPTGNTIELTDAALHDA